MRCIRCGQEIDIENDEFYRVSFFIPGDKIEDEVFYHKICYQEFHKQKFREEYKKQMDKLAPVLNYIVGGNSATKW